MRLRVLTVRNPGRRELKPPGLGIRRRNREQAKRPAGLPHSLVVSKLLGHGADRLVIAVQAANQENSRRSHGRARYSLRINLLRRSRKRQRRQQERGQEESHAGYYTQEFVRNIQRPEVPLESQCGRPGAGTSAVLRRRQAICSHCRGRRAIRLRVAAIRAGDNTKAQRHEAQ